MNFKDVNVSLPFQSRKLVHMPGVHCHPGASCTVAVLLCTLQDCIPTVSQYLYFRPRMSGSKQQWCSWRMLSCSVVSVAQSCPTLHDPVDCSLPDSSVHGILQGRILQWVATSSSRGSFQPRNRTLLLRCSSDYCSLCVCVCSLYTVVHVCTVMSNVLWPHGL